MSECIFWNKRNESLKELNKQVHEMRYFIFVCVIFGRFGRIENYYELFNISHINIFYLVIKMFISNSQKYLFIIWTVVYKYKN